MEIDFKHIYAYCPYNLRVRVDQKYKGTWYGVITDVDVVHKTFKIKGEGIWKYQPLANIRPILYRLDDLKKEIEHNGEKFVPLENLQELYPASMRDIKMIDYEDNSGQWMLNTHRDGEVSINIMRQIDQKLLEWHFDIFGLDKLAINANEIE